MSLLISFAAASIILRASPPESFLLLFIEFMKNCCCCGSKCDNVPLAIYYSDEDSIFEMFLYFCLHVSHTIWLKSVAKLWPIIAFSVMAAAHLHMNAFLKPFHQMSRGRLLIWPRVDLIEIHSIEKILLQFVCSQTTN